MNVLLLIVCLLSQLSNGEEEKIRVAVIGAGIGGCSSAYFMRQSFGSTLMLDVYEAKEVGGRIATVSFNNREYEAGGSMIHNKNQHMNFFRDLLGLKKRHSSPSFKLGLYDGNEFVFEGCGWSLCTVAKLFLHFGWDMIRINRYVADMLNKFDRIYSHQQQNHSFTTVEHLLSSMDPSFVNMTKFSIKDVLHAQGFSPEFTSQLTMAAMRNNYGQGLGINGFVGSVSLAGIEPGLWSVHGGNKLIPTGLLERAEATLINREVVAVVYDPPSKSFTIESVSDGDKEVVRSVYDIVVVAVPLIDHVSSIHFKGFEKPISNIPASYWPTVATFIYGKINATYFNHPHDQNFFDEIMTTDSKVFFNSIGLNRPVDYSASDDGETSAGKQVWKVFSKQPLSSSEKNLLFSDISEVEVVKWLAYPEYSPPDKLTSFQLAQNIYYVNSIELAASAIEMSAIGGKNVALLAHSLWYGEKDRVDTVNIHDAHVEL